MKANYKLKKNVGLKNHQDTYRKYGIGDSYCVYKSRGAFGEEYYYTG